MEAKDQQKDFINSWNYAVRLVLYIIRFIINNKSRTTYPVFLYILYKLTCSIYKFNKTNCDMRNYLGFQYSAKTRHINTHSLCSDGIFRYKFFFLKTSLRIICVIEVFLFFLSTHAFNRQREILPDYTLLEIIF